MAASDPRLTVKEPGAPVEAAVPAACATAPHNSPQDAPSADEFDPMRWEVPLLCKDCEKGFKVPYRHFQVGVVFHCPHCRGSFVPQLATYRAVRDAFEAFYSRRRLKRAEFARDGGDPLAFARRQEEELREFGERLDRLAREMRPAGKMVRPRGIASMFT